MLRLGLTGGIASGKSAVAAMLRDMGFSVLDADSLAHRLIEPGNSAYDEVLHEFGQAVLAPDGRVDRTKLSTIVFNDRARLDRLNAIIHPRVAEIVFRQFNEWERAGTHDAALVEAALGIESGIHKKLDGLVVAWCGPQQQLERLVARGLSEGEARRRIAAQLPVADKLRLATEKIDCSGSLEQTRLQVQALAGKLRRAQTAR
jgi:dephospho-CoA kinase